MWNYKATQMTKFITLSGAYEKNLDLAIRTELTTTSVSNLTLTNHLRLSLKFSPENRIKFNLIGLR